VTLRVEPTSISAPDRLKRAPRMSDRVPIAKAGKGASAPGHGPSPREPAWQQQLIGARLVPGTAADDYLATRGLPADIAHIAGA
jgi:hypothetical protein